MSDIKLFICCHKEYPVPRYPLLAPIQVGAALAENHFENFLHDDSGENISSKNRSYCELTAQYWAWKNADADYYGFFHYRRYLYPDVFEKRPYILEREPTLALLDKLGYDHFSELISNCDMLVPKREDMFVTVREHYAEAEYHRLSDLELAEKLVREMYPEYSEALDAYLSGTSQYFGNMFVMSKRSFFDYCQWLFPILEEFDKHIDLSCRTPQEKRVDGYIAERLLGVYITCNRERLRVQEIPRVHFEPNGAELFKKRAINLMLPPGTKRRAYVKARGSGRK